MCDIFIRTANQTLTFHVEAIVKPKQCTCNEGQVLQQNRYDNVADYSPTCLLQHDADTVDIPGESKKIYVHV